MLQTIIMINSYVTLPTTSSKKIEIQKYKNEVCHLQLELNDVKKEKVK